MDQSGILALGVSITLGSSPSFSSPPLSSGPPSAGQLCGLREGCGGASRVGKLWVKAVQNNSVVNLFNLFSF